MQTERKLKQSLKAKIMLIKDAEIDGEIFDVRVTDKTITQIETSLSAQHDETIINANGQALLAGLHDHHIHLNAQAAALQSVPCGPPEITHEEALINQLHSAANSGLKEIRGIGYHDSVAGEIDRDWLDKYGPDMPVRVQHRSGRLWICNSAALTQLQKTSSHNGRLYDSDLSIRHRDNNTPPDLRPLIQLLLSYGITGVTEVTPQNNNEDFKHLAQSAAPLKLRIMGKHELDIKQQTLLAQMGQVKFHYHDDNLPPLAQLVDEIKQAHIEGRGIAAHCVTHAELFLILAAIEEAGPHPQDRIEHAALTNDDTLAWIKKLGIGVVTQPDFIRARGAAYEKDVAPEDHPYLWRLRSFYHAGIPLAAGSDAPFGELNPWQGMASATQRPDFVETHRNETLTPEQALGLYQKQSDYIAKQRHLTEGVTADMCLLAQNWQASCTDLANTKIDYTFIDGKIVYTSASTNPHS